MSCTKDGMRAEMEHDVQPLSSEHILHDSTLSAPKEPSYEYTPLPDTNSFRLLTIHPGESTEPLTLSLTPVHFSGRVPAYEALSYVWGLEPGYETARCNGRLLKNVTTNLYKALVQLRLKKEERAVWVDALCM
jgi:hypothetical protein